MADDAVVHTGGNTPEQVAYKLLHDIAAIEGKALPDRRWLLDTYAECLLTVRNPDGRSAR